jgi:hypothetical protein
MSETVDVRVTDGDVWVDGDHYVRGDEVTIPAGVYERIPESFERVTETCDHVKDDGDVCGRDLPCRYHSDE